MGQAVIHVGTSGWTYAHWRGAFYPPALPQREWLRHYASRFRAVEVNGSFYRLPEAATFAAWRDTTPAGFVFAVKASRFLTHNKKLSDPAEPLERLLSRAGALDTKLGPVLFQLPPRWRVNVERLAAFLDAIPAGIRAAFELREPSWLCEEVYALLRARGAALVIYELAGFRSPERVTADFAYIRLHGPGGKYEGSYDDPALAAWAAKLRAWAAAGIECHCYFDNDQAAFAAANAARLAEMLWDLAR